MAIEENSVIWVQNADILKKTLATCNMLKTHIHKRNLVLD